MVRPFFLLIGVAFICLFSGCAGTSQSAYEGETQHGTASWYGYENGHATASGERLNTGAYTAAHRSLPFGTVVRVTNRLNGRSVEVRINDRGPWAGGDRIIDLSSAAADALDMKRNGLVPVELEVVSVGDGKRVNNG
jgi:rare lipoprotein A